MTPESLLAERPPGCLTAPCCLCGRPTTAPVEVRHIPPDTTLYACPEHATTVAPGPVAHEGVPSPSPG
ncbi:MULTISPECIES: hypothetical protein [Streptomyces]|uniref:Uncharacterized protein n=1 Tax=Streptomyces tsukubensis (strain DSM 42081 / NBRC 108919 / NRRL 18488 / 9993) TaxID=1114943 RepID=I2N0S0_STRT9|nr:MULTISPECIES: hypothetical protein [Streptomyces]AZK94811.1 hypothetical protein B7R87_13740 [Streptomyces tsukubensis]EIF90617.1 hypothetical protein [Streptomyces tsukubensis NRRL18488]MYS68744.1 hypothetical protein [Streptomyces sp. SID5473]QKM69107.1 hypothetical protein STSU_020030 [Streptomyces tsukubensis NRRL18488]TAI42961.1 hypothetical protein EWI31_21505 [Streptomyces tsukubensis]